MGQIGCAETSVRNYPSALRKILKERKSQRKMHCLGKITIKHVTRTQLSLINSTLHCYMFRFLRNHHRTVHTKHVKHLNGCAVHVSRFESVVRLPSDCSLWQLLLLVHKFLSWLTRRRFIKFLDCSAWWPNYKGRQKVTASTSCNTS